MERMVVFLSLKEPADVFFFQRSSVSGRSSVDEFLKPAGLQMVCSEWYFREHGTKMSAGYNKIAKVLLKYTAR